MPDFVTSIDIEAPPLVRVEFRLSALGAGARTRLDLLHTDLPTDEQPAHAQGWAHCLARLTEAAMARK